MSRVARYDPELARLAELKRREGIERARAGAKSSAKGRRRQVSGATWETQLEAVHRFYETHAFDPGERQYLPLAGEAFHGLEFTVARAHAKVTPQRDGEGRLVANRYERGAVDFVGRWLTHPIAFDLKSCQKASFLLKEEERHQLEFLQKFSHGGLAFFLVGDSLLGRLYLVPHHWVEVGLRLNLRTKAEAHFHFVERDLRAGWPSWDWLSILREQRLAPPP